jgi:hypothetical protein
LLDLHVLFAVEDGGCHFPRQHYILSSQAWPGLITIFIESGWGFAASSNP